MLEFVFVQYKIFSCLANRKDAKSFLPHKSMSQRMLKVLNCVSNRGPEKDYSKKFHHLCHVRDNSKYKEPLKYLRE